MQEEQKKQEYKEYSLFEEKEQSLFDEEELKPSQNNQSSNSRDEYIEKKLRKRGRVY